MNIETSANSHLTSLLVSEQIPAFVREDHPVFVEFIETYYKFLEQSNTGILTSDGASHYLGAEYASKTIPNIMDIDTTDFSIFIDSFKAQYGPHIPKQLHGSSDIKLFYKNLIKFYNAKGSEDSIKCLFRLLYAEEIDITYPKEYVLIASGGELEKYVRILVSIVGDIEVAKNHQIVGSVSGSTAYIDKIEYVSSDENDFSFEAGHKSSVSGQSFENIYASDRLLGISSEFAFLYLDKSTIIGTFAPFETIGIVDLPEFNAVVFPFGSKHVFYDGFQNYSNTSMFSRADNLLKNSSLPTNPPWTLGETTTTLYKKSFGVYDPLPPTVLQANTEGWALASAANTVFKNTAMRVQYTPLSGVGVSYPVVRFDIDNSSFKSFRGKDYPKIEIKLKPKQITNPTTAWHGRLSWGMDGTDPDHDPASFDFANRSVYLTSTGTSNVRSSFDVTTGISNTMIWDFNNVDGVANTPQSELWANSVITALEVSLYNDSAEGLIDHEIEYISVRSDNRELPLKLSDTGTWFSVAGQGETIVVDAPGSTTGQVLQIGNNSTTTAGSDGDMRWFVGTRNIKINPNKVYKMSVRMRHLGGNTYDSVTAAGSSNTLMFWAGLASIDKFKQNPIDWYGNERGDQSPNSTKWSSQNYITLGGVTEVDENWFTYDGYIAGVANSTGVTGTMGGTGGRDYSSVTSGFPWAGPDGIGTPPGYNSYIRAANGQSTFPRESTYMRPVFVVNDRHPGAGDEHPYSQGITQIDYVSIEEMSTFIFDEEYMSTRHHLSSSDALLRDGWYTTDYGYEISSKHSMSEYEDTLKKMAHPAGMKLFAQKKL